MRKEIVYSLAAVAAIPVLANATESSVNTQVMLSATTENQTGEMTIAKDVPLVKADKYAMVFGKLNLQSTPLKPFTVTITAKKAGVLINAQEVAKGGDSIRIEFTLAEADEVTVKVNCEEPYAVTDPFISLEYDFEAAADRIEEYASKVVLDTLVHYISNDNNHYTSLQTDAKAFADSIRNAAKKENEAIAYEDVYKRFHLYDAPNDSVIEMIKQRSAIAKALEVAALTDSLTELTDSLDKLFPADLRGEAYEELDEMGDSIADLINKFEAGLPAVGEEDPVTSPDVQNALAELKAALGVAAAKKEFYDARKKDVDTLTIVKDLVKADLTADLTNANAENAVLTDMQNEIDGSTKSVRKAIEALEGKIKNAYKDGDLNEKWTAGLSAEKDSIWMGTLTITKNGNTADTIYSHNGYTSNKNVLGFIHEKYTFLAMHAAFADSVISNADTFAVQKFATTPGADSIYYVNYKKSLQYQKGRYDAIIKAVKGENEVKHLNDSVTNAVNHLTATIKTIADTTAFDKRANIELYETNTPQSNYSYPKKHIKALSDSTYKVIQALDAYEEYAPYKEMEDSIKALEDSLKAYKLDSVYTVEVMVDGQKVKKTYKPSEYVKQTMIINKQKVGLSIDSINAQIAALRDTVTKIKTPAQAKTFYEATAAPGFKPGGTAEPKPFAGYTVIKANIKSLGEAAVAAAKEWEKIQKRLLELEDSAIQVRKLVENLPIYTRSVKDKNGIEYGNYKVKLDSILKSKYANGVYNFVLNKDVTVDADGKVTLGNSTTQYMGHSIKTLTDSLTALKGAVAEGTHTAKLTSLYKEGNAPFGKDGLPKNGGNTIADTTAIDSALQALKANYKKDSIAYDTLMKAALLDTLKASVKKMIQSLYADSAAIMFKNEKDTAALIEYYGETGFESLDQQLSSLFKDQEDGLASVSGEDALAEAGKDNNDVDTEKLRQYAEQIRPLVERMQIIKEAAKNYRENQEENFAKYSEIKAVMASYEAKFQEAVKLVAPSGAAEKVFMNGFANEARWYADSIGHVDSLYYNTNPREKATNSALGEVKGALKADTLVARQKDGLNSVADFKSLETATSIDSVYNIWRKGMLEDNADSRLSATGDKWLGELNAIVADLDKAMNAMRARQRNYDAFELITKLYPAVNTAIGNALDELENVEDSTAEVNAFAHYIKEIANNDSVFRGKDYFGEIVNQVPRDAEFDGKDLNTYLKVPTHNVSEIRKSYDQSMLTARRFVDEQFKGNKEDIFVINHDTIVDNGVRDSVLLDYLEQKSVENQMYRIGQLTDIINELGDIAKRATENKSNWGLLKTQWNTDSVKRKAVKDSIDAYPIPAGKAAAQALWDVQDGRLNNVKPDELYKNGQLEGVKYEEQSATLTDIWNKLDEIRLSLLTGDDLAAAVAQANNGLKDALADKIQEARDTYKDAVDLQQEYQSVTNPILREAIAAAQEEAGNYNDVLATYPAKINEAKQTIEGKINAATEKNQVYPDKPDFENDTVGINRDIIQPLKNLSAEFASIAKAAVQAKLDAIIADAAKDTLRAKFYRDNVDLIEGSTEDLATSLAAYEDGVEALKKAVAKDDIKLIEQKLNALELLGKEMWSDLEAACASDLTTAYNKAVNEIIPAGDEYYKDIDVNVPSMQAAEKAQWEAAKLWILGNDEKKIVGAAQLLDSVAANDTAYYQNYFEFSVENQDLGTTTVDDGEGYQIYKYLKDFYNPNKNPFVKHNLSKEALDALQADLDDVQAALQRAITATEEAGYAVAGMMQRDGGFAEVQNKIDNLLAYAKYQDAFNGYKPNHNDSSIVDELYREIEVIMNNQVDTNKVQGDAKPFSVDSTLYAMEKDFLYSLRTLMNTQFNKIAAVAAPEEHTDAERAAAKELEDEIIALYHDLDGVVAQKAKDKNNKDSLIAKAEELLPIQERAEALLAKLTAAANDAEGTAFAKQQLINQISDLIQKAEDAKAGEGLNYLTPEEKAELAEDLDEVIGDLEELEGVINGDTNFFYNEDDYEGQLVDADNAINAALAKAQFQNGINSYLNGAIEVAEGILNDLKDYINDGADALHNEFGTSDYDAKIARIWNQIYKGEDILNHLKAGQYAMPTEDGGLEWKDIPSEQTAPLTPAYIANLIYMYAIGGMMPSGILVDGPDDGYHSRLAEPSLIPVGDEPGIGNDEATVVVRPNYYAGSLMLLSWTLKWEMDLLLNQAASDDIESKQDALEEQCTSLRNRLDRDKLLTSEYAYYMSQLSGIQSEIDALDDSRIDYDGNYEDLKEKAEDIQERLDALKQQLAEANALKDRVGDVDGDGDIDERDFIALINIVRDQLEDELDEEEFYRADLDGNGRITVTDIVLLRDYLLGLSEADDEVEARSSWFDKKDIVEVKTVSTENGVTRLAVNLTNEQSYRALQLDLQLNGATVKAASLGERTQGVLFTNQAEDGSFRLFTIPATNQYISGNQGAVVYLDIEGAAEITGTALFTTNKNKEVSFDLSGTTAIDKLKNAAAAAGQKVYNLGGRMMDGLKKGVNILRGEDGSAKKVIKK